MSSNASLSYRPDIDGLRGLAVLMVVLFHAGLGFKGGYVGVDIFFVISGYLITGLLFKELDRGGIDLAGFWERRLRRIAPALTVMLLLTMLVGYFLLFPPAFIGLGESAIAQALLCANLYFWRDSGYFAAASEEKPLLHLWSLAVEEQFYIVLPVVLILGHRWLACREPGRSSRKALMKGLSCLLLLSFVAGVIGVFTDANTAFYWLPTRAWELLVGSVLAAFPESWGPRGRRQRDWVGAGALVMIFIAALAYESDTPFPGAAALLPCLGAAGLIWAHSFRPPAAQGAVVDPWSWYLLTWRPLVAVGLISYSLYLWHWPLLAFAQYITVSGESRPPLSLRLGLVLLAFVLAWASWRWVETPFRLKRVCQTRGSVFAWAVGSLLLFIGLGWQIVHHQGLPGRMPEAALQYAQGREDKGAAAVTWTGLEAAQRGDFPQIGKTEGEPPVQVMLWGDSHARSLMPALDELCRENGVAGEVALFSATAPMTGFYRRSRHGLNERSEVLAQAVFKRVREKQIRHTVLAAYWQECPGKEPDLFSAALVKTVTALKATGTQPWVILDVPTQPFDVPKALALGQLPGAWFTDPSTRTVSVDEHRRANAIMQNLVQRLQAAGARVVDPVTLLSAPDGRTLIESEGRSLYTDAHHLSLSGARLLKPLFVPVMPLR